jgi:hypothetical protein
MTEEQLAEQNMRFFTRHMVGEHFSVNPNRPTGGTWGRQCLRCKDIEIIGPCTNCGNELYETPNSAVYCTKCELVYTRWTCRNCNADNPISATFGGITTKGSCFIATAAYESNLAPEVETFRSFRDAVLVRTVYGSAFVALYYRTSPPIARYIRRSPNLRKLTRKIILNPLLRIIKVRMNCEK